eukprot:8169040-Heterocapsa_arctica.AAC.1
MSSIADVTHRYQRFGQWGILPLQHRTLPLICCGMNGLLAEVRNPFVSRRNVMLPPTTSR